MILLLIGFGLGLVLGATSWLAAAAWLQAGVTRPPPEEDHDVTGDKAWSDFDARENST
jgi:hypothetical protein